MDSSDEWLNFRERLVNMGEEPSEDLIELLEDLCGIMKPISIKHEEEPKTQMDIFLDNVENKINEAQKIGTKFKSRLLSKKNNNMLRLQK